MDDVVLDVKDLRTELDTPNGPLAVVDGLSFQLKRGKTLALLGESGCGKSMTALSLLRILPQPPMLDPQGAVMYRGQNLLTLRQEEMRSVRGKGIAMIFQDPSSALNPVYTIADQFLEVLELHLGLGEEEGLERCLQVLREVGIPAPEQRLFDYPHQLSGGMKQRMMIAMALLCEPDILIADEPTTALDVTIQAQVLDLLRRLQEKRGMAILLITHDMGVVAELAHDVIVMYASRPVESAPVETLFDHMGHPYTRALFSSLPRPEQQKGDLPAIPGAVPPLNSYPEGCRFHPRCSQAMPCCKQGAVPRIPLRSGQDVHCWLHAPEQGGVS